jgi:high-affinity K+ transport system ATPase subunit B
MPIVSENNNDQIGNESAQNGGFPRDKEGVAAVRAKFVEMLFSNKFLPKIAKQLQRNPKMAMTSLSKMLAMMIAKILSSLRDKQGGTVHKNLVEMLMKLAVEKVSNIAEQMNLDRMPPEAAQMLLRSISQELKAILRGQGSQGLKNQQAAGQMPAPQQMPPQGQGPPSGIVNGEVAQ